ncbi:MAG: helix-turn-helix domain-containing protein, partial [Planctomycetota bacterium]
LRSSASDPAATADARVHRGPSSSRPLTLAEAVDEYRREMVRRALEETGGNVAAAACRLALDRSNLRRLMRRLSMTP